MRKLLYTLIAVLGFTTMSFAQEASNTAQAADKLELISSKESGEYTFTFPSSISIQEIEKKALNYNEMITVSIDATSHKVTIGMVENTDMNRKIMVRMMMSCGIQYVNVNGEDLEMYNFLKAHL